MDCVKITLSIYLIAGKEFPPQLERRRRKKIMTTYECNSIFGDIYGRREKVMVTKRLEKMPYAQAGVIEREDAIILVSYSTVAACIENDWLSVSCLCSATTRKHVSAFLKEYAPSIGYYTAKNLYLNDLKMNVNTGEVKPLFEKQEQEEQEEA